MITAKRVGKLSELVKYYRRKFGLTYEEATKAIKEDVEYFM